MGIIIAKTVLSTLDVLIAGGILYGTKGKERKIIGTGVVVFTSLNIAAMWL